MTGLLVLLIPLAGCAKRSAVQAESRETRLTEGGAMCLRPIYSPDGASIVYSVREQGDPPRFSIRLVSSDGGAPRTIRSDSTANVAMSWAPDGDGLYILTDKGDARISLIDLKGEVVKSLPRPKMARFLSVSPDGNDLLYSVFNKDNWDLALLSAGVEGEPKVLAETPAWETGGCFGPGSGEITVVSRSVFGAPTNEFFIWSPDTREFKPLPLPKAKNDMPAWSKDGRYLAYATDQSGSMNLWVLDMTGGRSVEVTSGPEDDSRPDWSPDGQSIVFLRGTKSCHIFIADPETREKTQLTSGQVCDYDPMISMDGKWVAFIREKVGAARTSPVLAWASVEGGPVHEVDLKGLTFNASGGVAWSPNADELAFAADDGSGNVDIYRAKREGGAPARVTVTPGTDVIPFWSPDGRTIGYTRAAGGETQVWAIPSGGGVPSKVSLEDSVNQLSCFSPEGQRVAYMTVRSDGAYDLKVSDLGQQKPGRPIYHSEKGVYPLGWSKDGKYVAAWKMGSDESSILAVAADGTEHFTIGDAEDEPDGRGYFINLTPRGRAFADLVYPGGTHAFQYGDNTTDVYVVHVADLLRASVTGARAGGAR
jgi:Tol biopolymer transport system component